MSNSTSFTPPNHSEISAALEKADAVLKNVLALGDFLDAAERRLAEAQQAYATSLSDQDYAEVESATAEVSSIQGRIETLRTVHDLLPEVPLAEIAREVRRTAIDWQPVRTLFIEAWQARLTAAEALLEPAQEGLVATFSRLLKSGMGSLDAERKAAESSPSGAFVKAVQNHITFCRSQARRFGAIEDGSAPTYPTSRDLQGLCKPLPSPEAR